MDVQYYITDEGVAPITKWLNGLRDKKTKAVISLGIRKIKLNLLGAAKSVGDGVYELKIDFGPGYRVYFAQSGKDVVLLLCAGDKGTQDKDIRTAKQYWEHEKARNKKEK